MGKAKANMLTNNLAGVITMALMWVLAFAACSAQEPLVFNTTTPTNDLKGSLAARVQFAQSQILPFRPQKGDNQPHLIGHRKSLLMVRPLKADSTSPLQVTARDKGGKTLGSLSLNPPEHRPAPQPLTGPSNRCESPPCHASIIHAGFALRSIDSPWRIWNNINSRPFWRRMREPGFGGLPSI